MKTLLRLFACSWRPLLAPLLLLLTSAPSGAQQASRHPTRPAHSSRSSLGRPSKSRVSSVQALPHNSSTTTPTPVFRQDALFTNPSFEPGRYAPPIFGGGPTTGWYSNCSMGSHLLPNTTGTYDGWGSSLTPADGNAYIGLPAWNGEHASVAQRLRDTLKAGVTYTFLLDVAYGRDYYPQGWVTGDQVPLSLQVWGNVEVPTCAGTPSSGTLLWSKLIPMSQTSWQTETVIFTPTVDITNLSFMCAGTTRRVDPAPCHPNVNCGPHGALLLDNLRTLTGIALKKADATAQPAGKAFRLLWQPVLSVGGLDSLARPQLKGTVTTFQGGRVPLPANLQGKDGKGFYFFQEATPAAGQDTLYYGLYVRNTPLANGAKDDTLRHLYQCRRTFGSQNGSLPLGGSLAPLTFGSPSTAQRASLLQEASPALDAAPLSRRPTAPQPALSAQRQRAR